ncbi:putative ferric-chelate reductase 1 [Triplophysa rosa]|uniref:Ferric-chelate reductase 1 n=1 Tax=Triplophysa rosa TaxID=992332 RepID=A0A9W7WVE0_TRIRA|nr:putative ferric-chelate reductase 1 [Triplophysa rosa]KAI7809267.1 hypothetical protein IRJ41_003967 [Triplophysa rosa]
MDSRLVFLVAFVIASAVPYTKANGNITALNYTLTRSDCGKTKLCVEKPTACDPSGTSGCFFTSTRISSIDTSLAFELSGNSTGYIAMAAGVSSNVSQGSNTVFVCGNNNGTFFFQTARLTNNTLETTTSPSVSNIQYRLNESSLIQCAFNIPIISNFSEALTNLGINFTTFNMSNLANAKFGSFLEVFQGSSNGTALGQPKSAFGSSFSVNLANVNSTTTTTITTTTTAAPTTKPTKNGSTSLFSHAALCLLAAVALRFL